MATRSMFFDLHPICRVKSRREIPNPNLQIPGKSRAPREIPNPNFQIPSKSRAPREISNPNFQIPGKSQLSNSKKSNHWLFEIIEEKIRVNSRASAASRSRAASVAFSKPTSINRRNKRLSFASLRQIFTRITKSFLLQASSASIQLAATDPHARTDCRISSALLTVLGNCLQTSAQTLRIGTSDLRGHVALHYLPFESWELLPCCLGFAAAGSVHGRK